MSSTKILVWLLAAAAAALGLAGRGAAQELPGTHSTATPPPAPAKAPALQQALPQAPLIVANVELVNMTFSVQDKHGAFVPDLSAANFRVLEDGRPQAIKYFSVEDALPLTLGLLLDTSPSQARVLGEEQQVSDSFFRQVITPKDLAFVIGFDEDTNLLQDLTSSQPMLSAAVDQAHIGGGSAAGGLINPGPFPSASGGGATHLWDAIYLACQQELAKQVGRKAIVVVTDGGEQGSTYTDKDALRAALDSNTIVYAVLAADRGFGGYGAFGAGPGPGQLAKLTEQTGGRTIDARGKNLLAAYDQIQKELRSQYTLGYRSDQPDNDGKFRAVKIDLVNAPEDKVRARTGYFALPQP